MRLQETYLAAKKDMTTPKPAGEEAYSIQPEPAGGAAVDEAPKNISVLPAAVGGQKTGDSGTSRHLPLSALLIMIIVIVFIINLRLVI